MILKHLWKSGLAAVVLVFYSMLPVNAQSKDVGTFIDQVIEAYGGRANIPWILDSMRSKIRITKAKDGQSVLEVPVGKGMYLNAFVDAKTHLVTRAETVAEGAMKLQFAADYSDFRKVNNILFPFHEENYASGSHTATTKVDNIKCNLSGKDLELPIPK